MLGISRLSSWINLSHQKAACPPPSVLKALQACGDAQSFGWWRTAGGESSPLCTHWYRASSLCSLVPFARGPWLQIPFWAQGQESLSPLKKWSFVSHTPSGTSTGALRRTDKCKGKERRQAGRKKGRKESIACVFPLVSPVCRNRYVIIKQWNTSESIQLITNSFLRGRWSSEPESVLGADHPGTNLVAFFPSCFV